MDTHGSRLSVRLRGSQSRPLSQDSVWGKSVDEWLFSGTRSGTPSDIPTKGIHEGTMVPAAKSPQQKMEEHVPEPPDISCTLKMLGASSIKLQARRLGKRNDKNKIIRILTPATLVCGIKTIHGE